MKTIEEIAHEVANQYAIGDESYYRDCGRGVILQACYEAATKATASQWHNVNDGYPQCDNDVFVAHKSSFTDTIMYGVASYYNNEWYTSDDNITTSNIFAWMYIPKLPKNESK